MRGFKSRFLLSAVLAATAVVGAACSDNDGDDTTTDTEESEMNGEQMGETLDPNGLLASLAFVTADDDARYRCLLDRLGAQARTAGFEAFEPLEYRGDVLKSWCLASGNDGNECMRGLVLGLRDRGSQGMAVWAFQESTESPIEEYGYRVGRNPGADAMSVWALDFERMQGSVDRFNARFVPFDGEERNYGDEINVGDRATYQIEDLDVDGVLATIEPEGSPAEFLATLVESSARFSEMLAARQDALLVEYERLIGMRDNTSDAARMAAIERAREDIAAERAILIENADTMHALLFEAAIGEDCN